MPSVSSEHLRICYLSFFHGKNKTAIIQLLQYIDSVGLYLWPVRLAVAVVSGLVSLVNVLVFTRKPMRGSSLNLLLTALELSNVLMCAIQIVYSSVQVIQGGYATSTHVAMLKFLCVQVTALSAVLINWISVIISFWRYLAVKEPLKVSYCLSRKRAVLIVIITLFVIISPDFLSFVTFELTKKNILICSSIDDKTPTNFTFYRLTDTSWSLTHVDLVTYLSRSLIVINYLLPILLLFVTTICLLTTICGYKKRQSALREGQKSQMYIEEKETRTTVILIVLLGFYLLSNSAEVVIGHMNQTETFKNDQNILKISLFLQGSLITQVTNIFSILAYYFMGTKFRSTLHELFSWN